MSQTAVPTSRTGSTVTVFHHLVKKPVENPALIRTNLSFLNWFVTFCTKLQQVRQYTSRSEQFQGPAASENNSLQDAEPNTDGSPRFPEIGRSGAATASALTVHTEGVIVICTPARSYVKSHDYQTRGPSRVVSIERGTLGSPSTARWEELIVPRSLGGLDLAGQRGIRRVGLAREGTPSTARNVPDARAARIRPAISPRRARAPKAPSAVRRSFPVFHRAQARVESALRLARIRVAQASRRHVFVHGRGRFHRPQRTSERPK